MERRNLCRASTVPSLRLRWLHPHRVVAFPNNQDCNSSLNVTPRVTDQDSSILTHKSKTFFSKEPTIRKTNWCFTSLQGQTKTTRKGEEESCYPSQPLTRDKEKGNETSYCGNPTMTHSSTNFEIVSVEDSPSVYVEAATEFSSTGKVVFEEPIQVDFEPNFSTGVAEMHIVSNILHALPEVPDISLNFEMLEEISVVHCLEIPTDGYPDSKALFSDHLLEDMMMDSDRTAHMSLWRHMLNWNLMIAQEELMKLQTLIPKRQFWICKER
ncbi:hypothetical protein LR48_Vigan05g139400 [Vigna angularis]|uniref:Uncharacterized protein n=1 Tax=Phaseolus angularis TaxID=3914 RepID=A0A0L9UML1_PHAAN|nr:hypothetical protein LR48_Vigan05g139400 [Vigna angularis]